MQPKQDVTATLDSLVEEGLPRQLVIDWIRENYPFDSPASFRLSSEDVGLLRQEYEQRKADNGIPRETNDSGLIGADAYQVQGFTSEVLRRRNPC